MIKKTVTYNDFDGKERTEDFYFNLTETELAELELSHAGGLKKAIEKIIAAQDSNALIKIFKDIVILSYGEKSPDGRRFIKTQDVVDAFTQTEAYSSIFMELAFNDVAAAEFINGLPSKGAKKQ